MKAHEISTDVYCIHADIHTEELFEGIWPIPRGVSLNSYLVRGRKTALIDLVRDWNAAPQQLEDALASIGLSFKDVDYLILNHLEPDHTGWIRELRDINPDVEIVTSSKGTGLLKSFYKLETKVRAVKDGDTLDLGGRTLTFIETPNLHWPETMTTFDASSGTLFSCDAFGSFGALGDNVFDDQFSREEHQIFEEECLRYYANIVASFSSFVERGVKKLENLAIRCVAPSHGMVWRRDPQAIIQRYVRYASYAKGPAERSVAVIWGSMYGNTRKGMEAVLRGLEQEGVPYTCYRVPNDNISDILTAAYKSTGLFLAMPTYEYAMFPPMAYALDMFRRKHITGKIALRIGAWGWVGGAKKDYEALSEPLKLKHLESFEWAGEPSAEDIAALEERGRALAREVKAGSLMQE